MMSDLYAFISERHDMTLVGVALSICLLAAFSSIGLVNHARRSSGQVKALWLGVAATAGGVGLWATHFLALLGFRSGIVGSFSVPLTLLSLLISVSVTLVGFWTATRSADRRWAFVGGVVLGLGAAAMHVCGMAAYEVPGHLAFDVERMVSAVLVGCLLTGVAIFVGLGQRRGEQALSALLLSLAIGALHFLAMSAVSVRPDPRVIVSQGALPAWLLATCVAFATALVLLSALLGLMADLWSRKRTMLETDRLRSLADAAVEGLLICDGDAVVSGNTSIGLLTGFNPSELAGMTLSRCLPDRGAIDALLLCPDTPVETQLATRAGTTLPVEIILHGVHFAGKTHRAIAVRDLRSRKQAEDRIRFLAHHDFLTGLPNRALFEARLDDAIEAAQFRGCGLAVLCLDLDRFKEINDLFGHPAGDDVLRAIGRVLADLLRGGQTAARLGGDEFAVILPEAVDADAAKLLAEAILRATSALSALQVTGPAVATSIGIALFPRDGTDRRSLLSAADTALYHAKSDGRGTFRFYDDGMGAEIRDRRRIEHDLRAAIGRGEMSLVYQPQMAVDQQVMVGFEALLRWLHPVRGSVSPALFIPIAEDSGAILAIGEWVLRTACVEAATWTNPLRVAVNVSAAQLHAHGFARFVETVLAETGLDPSRLELEVTETALIRDMERAVATLRQLKSLGIKIAMDDFGTGYSSLSNLRAFPFDRIKIDASFIQSVDSNRQASAIVRAILELGRGLGLPILAEGVETRAELAFLDAELCHEVQGFLFGRPAAIETYVHAISARREATADEARELAA